MQQVARSHELLYKGALFAGQPIMLFVEISEWKDEQNSDKNISYNIGGRK
jgi:hypothetical protein